MSNQLSDKAAKHRLVPLLLSLFAVAGFLVIYIPTHWGIGVSPDSATYIAGARTFSESFNPMLLESHWPPGYPILLWLMSLNGDDILNTTRVLHALLFAGNLLLFIAFVVRITSSYSNAIIISGLAFLTSFQTLYVHYYAWSESPLLALQLLSMHCLLSYWRNYKSTFFFTAAVLAGLALFMRYAGVVFIGSVALTLLFTEQEVFTRRLRKAVLFGITAISPFVLWTVSSILIRNESTNREFVTHIVSIDHLRELLILFANWLGASANPVLFLFIITLSAFCIYNLIKHRQILLPDSYNTQMSPAIKLMVCYALCYTLFILFSKSFLDAYIPLDNRIFIPVYLMLLLLICSSLVLLLKANKLAKMSTGVWLGLFILLNSLSAYPFVSSLHQNGIGYLNSYMSSLPSLSGLEQLKQVKIYSNAADFIELSGEYQSDFYPYKLDPTTQQLNPDYQQEFENIFSEASLGEAVLVHYGALESRRYFPLLPELIQMGFTIELNGQAVFILSTE